jgi:hypothetical protein
MKEKDYCLSARDGFDDKVECRRRPPRTMRTALLVLSIAMLGLTGASHNACAQEYTIVIKDHLFTPSELRVPAKKRFTVFVDNQDPTPEEFESLPMKVEKVIPGKSKAVVRIGPLEAGRYEFVGEFNAATAKGVMIAE